MAFDIYMICFMFIVGILFGLIAVIMGIKCPIRSKVINTCECDNTFKWNELIPIFSFFISKGECPYCKKNISLWYSFLELLSGLMFSFSYIFYGFSYEMIVMLIITFLSILIFVSDFKYYIILERPLIFFTILVLGLKFLFFGSRTFLISVISGVMLFAFMLLIRFIGTKVFGRDALGGGDVKLVGFFGILFGLKLSVIALILGAFLAFPIAVYYSLSNQDKDIPFGPFLVTGLYLVFLFMDKIRLFLSIIFR